MSLVCLKSNQDFAYNDVNFTFHQSSQIETDTKSHLLFSQLYICQFVTIATKLSHSKLFIGNVVRLNQYMN